MRSVILVLVIFSILSSSCVAIERVPGDFPYARMLTPSDLGPSWSVEQQSFHDIPEAQYSHAITFRRNNNEKFGGPFLVDQLTVYPGIGEAEAAINYWTTEKLEEVLDSPPSFDYMPSDPNDFFTSECEGLTIDGEPYRSCEYIQQHDNLVLYVHGMMDDVAFTQYQFERIMSILDAKLNLSISKFRG